MSEIKYKEVELNGRTIKYRKWKVKDKINLDKLIDTEENKLENDIAKRQIFVYDCLEDPNTPLDIEEYNYLLALIRDYSLHNTIEYTLECDKCDHEFDYGMTSAQIVEPIFANYQPIEYNQTVITVGNVTDKENYENDIMKSLTLSERFIVDFAYHVKTINGNDIEPKEVISYLENCDVDFYENIFTQWELMKFKCNMVHNVECPYCHKVDSYEFKEMTNFFPESWNI